MNRLVPNLPAPETMRRKFGPDDLDDFHTLRSGSRVRDCEGDAWFRTADGDWLCEADDVRLPSLHLLNDFGPVVRIRAMAARRPQ